MLSQNTLVDSLAITTAISAQVQGVFSGLYGMKEVTVEANFVRGSGGTNCKVWIQTSLDGGSNWIDIMNFAFTTSSLRKIHTVVMPAVVATRTNITPTAGTMGDNLILDGVLGDRLRAVVTTTGTYAGTTTLDVNFVPKGA